MGYLDNTSITVDAILTKRGRELLSRNDGSFKITQFALGDDEIDYTLFNTTHPNGTQYSAEAIENMPLIEAIPHGANCLKSKLITLNRGALSIPYIQIDNLGDAQSMQTLLMNQGQGGTITATTLNFSTTNGGVTTASEDYIFTVLDHRLVEDQFSATGGLGDTQDYGAVLNEFTTIATAVSVRGRKCNMIGTTSNVLFSDTVTTRTSSVIVEGVSSGAIVVVPIQVTYVP